jgi:hypothetical protein
MLIKFFFTICLFIISSNALSRGYNVYSIGLYDVKFDGSQTNSAIDFRYERRFDLSLFEVGPEEENFFNLKPLAGIEFTSDSASYINVGVYIDDNLGTLFVNKKSPFNFTPSFALGYYDNGDGKNLGNNIEFRTTAEISYELKSSNRIGLSFGHISNANIGNKNPGVEILSFSYQVPFN